MNNNKLEIMLCRSINMLIKSGKPKEEVLNDLMLTEDEYETMIKNKNDKVISLYQSRRIKLENLSDKLKIPKLEIEQILKENKIDIRSPFNDITNKKFGRLTVICESGRNQSREVLWKCKCECKNEVLVTYTNLNKGYTKSCGCLQKEMVSESNKTHGDSKTKLYMIWSDMRKRCSNKNHHAYKYYGEKGVKVDKEWNSSFITFKEWSLNNGYAIGLSIDRIDVNGNYEPSNCRWVTHKAQMNNTTRNNNILYNGKTQSLTDWCEELNLPYSRMRYRLKKIKMSPEEAFTTPRLSSKKYTRNTN